jgi:hypothetical protein
VDIFGETSLGNAYERLAGNKTVQDQLKKEYGDKAGEYIDDLKKRNKPADLGVCDFLEELIHEGAREVAAFSAEGSEESYSIVVMEYCGIYFVSASEHDDAGYFGNLNQAQDYIELNWAGCGLNAE